MKPTSRSKKMPNVSQPRSFGAHGWWPPAAHMHFSAPNAPFMTLRSPVASQIVLFSLELAHFWLSATER